MPRWPGYSDQLQAGQGYSKLKATYSVCLVMRKLWEDDRLHHQFQLVERATGRVLEDSIEIHIVELSKYNGVPGEVPPQSSVLEHWCYWIEEKAMYDSREKAILDYESNLIDAREEGREEGEAIGKEKGEAIGIEKGRIQLLQELLGGPALSTEELNEMSLQELHSTTKSLQSKLRERNA